MVNEELYVFGGRSTIVISSVQIYDPETNRWRLSTDLSAPREYSAAAVHDGSAYIFGGHGPELDLSDNEQLILPFPCVGNQRKWDTFVKERLGRYGSGFGLPQQVVVAFAAS